MELAIIGSRNAPAINIGDYVDCTPSAIITGGARGVDAQAAAFARERGITLIEYKPDYARYRRGAPIRRDETIAKECDAMIAFWNGESRGTEYTFRYAQKLGKPVRVIRI